MRTKTSNWFECSVKCEKTSDDGTFKKVAEQYVVEALSFTEAEANILQNVAAYCSGEFEVVGMKPAKFNEIAFEDDVKAKENSKFYKMNVSFITIDEKTGKEKLSNHLYLVEADSLKRAIDNADEMFAKSMIDYVSVNANVTKFLDVFESDNKQ